MTNSIAGTPKFCKDCKWLHRKTIYLSREEEVVLQCHHLLSARYNLVTGERWYCDAEYMRTRFPGSECGPAAKLFEPIESSS